ncbi:MAG: Lon protease family protein [bacterium]
MIQLLKSEFLRKVCTEDITTIKQSTNYELPDELIDQQRAQEALKLGLKIKADGFNVFACGEEGTGKLSAAKLFLEKLVKNEPTPSDWCYVNNFKDAYQPSKLELPAGHATALKKDMKEFVSESMQALIKVFESEEYSKRRKEISEKNDKKQSEMTLRINEKAAKESLLIKQTPWEIYTVPIINGETISDEEFDKLPVAEKQLLQEKQLRFAEEMNAALKEQKLLEKETLKEHNKLENEVAGFAITELINEVKHKYKEITSVIEYLDNVHDDILGNLPDFMLSHKEKLNGSINKGNEYLKRYEVNVLIDNSKQNGSPIIIENNPTYNNLIGSVEKESLMGSLVTDFTMIRKGSLHKANGGYLIIRASELFKNYFSWEALKRSVRNKEIMIEEATEQLGYFTTKTLKPEPIPLNVKVILVGSGLYYHLLFHLDNDFKSLFKIKADFNTVMERTGKNIAGYISFFDSICKKEKLESLDEQATRKLIEFGSRSAEDQKKLSTQFGKIADVVREADHYAKEELSSTINEVHVKKAIEQKTYRSNLIQEKINDMIKNKQILIDLSGKKVGQVNALSIIDMGDIMIGKPSRITCTVNLGKTGVIAIEREAELSGPIHTKGVMILTGYLSERFFQDKPVSLSARLVFEQSYAEVEGDSASSTELYALLSSLANVPIKQGIAVTGSVNQKGEIQAIGGINEKIEGYYEICKIIGFDGQQGIIIPSSNIQNLMLKEEVVDAVAQNKFSLWAIDTIDDGIEVLTDMKAGGINEQGTINYMVNNILAEFSNKIRKYSNEDGEEETAFNQRHWISDVTMRHT